METKAPEDGKRDETFVADLSTAILAAGVLRDLAHACHYYPDDIPKEDAQAYRRELGSTLNAALTRAGLRGEVKEACGAADIDLDNLEATEDCTSAALLFATILLRHPDIVEAWDPTDGPGAAKMKDVYEEARKVAAASVRSTAEQLDQIRFFDCRIPKPGDDPTYKDPRRFAQLLREYWPLCRHIVAIVEREMVGYTPHPLLPLINNLHLRIEACFVELRDIPGSCEAQEAADYLLDTVISGEPDELVAVPEYTNQRSALVQSFIERSRTQLGSRIFPLTPEEESFIAMAKTGIDRYEREVKRTSARFVENARRAAAEWRAESDARAAGGKRTGAPRGVTLRRVVEILQDSDEERTIAMLARWNKSRVPKPESIGGCPSDRRKKLYLPTAIVDYAKKVEGALTVPEEELVKRLTIIAVEPRAE